MKPETEASIRQELQVIEDQLYRVEDYLVRIRGERDTLVRKLCDWEGCHDRRKAVR